MHYTTEYSEILASGKKVSIFYVNLKNAYNWVNIRFWIFAYFSRILIVKLLIAAYVK